MNIQKYDILNALLKNPYTNQRELAKSSGHSLGIVNRSIKELIENGFLDENHTPTPLSLNVISKTSPKNAIILAAGFGMRMVPINTEVPKGLIEVHGEPLIERLIKQLHEVNIKKIYIVVGFMKEQYEYLIDQYGVELIVNKDYASKNNLHSLKTAMPHLSNTYIIPCDIWCKKNPFNRYELYSWYLVSDKLIRDSSIRVNRKMELVVMPEINTGNLMLGIAYLTEDTATYVKKQLEKLCLDQRHDNSFWEETLYKKGKMIIPARVLHSDEAIEINTYEQLREIDDNSNQLKSDAIAVAAQALSVSETEITDITVLKKGMTNRSFLFSCNDQRYIMRIPGEGTDQLINRKNEAAVYQTISDKNLCDDIEYINPDNGYKITRFFPDARVCAPSNILDVKKCMKKLRSFHELKLKVKHRFDLFEQINFYESLWKGKPSIYRDYTKTKEHIFSLISYIKSQPVEEVLTHIDAVPDNFLFITGSSNSEEIRLIDWEYAGMQDPHVDIAMFCIYSLYERINVDETINAYFPEGCSPAVRIKIYCYIAVCGLLWSNWCEYKRSLGVDFGEYSLKQYRYAKDYYKIVQDELNKNS